MSAEDSPSNEGTDEVAHTDTRRGWIRTTGTVAAGLAAGPSAASAQDGTETPGPLTTDGLLDFSQSVVVSPYLEESALTRARHRMEWGTGPDSLRKYEDDSGETATLPGYVPREDSENVVTVRADKFQFPAAWKFPRGEMYDASGDGDANTKVSALDPTHWSTGSSMSVSSADVDPDYAITVESSGLTSGSTATATFSDVDLTDSPGKRFMRAVVSVNTLTSGSTVEIVARDDDGDEKVVSASPGADTSASDVFADATGDGYVVQQRLADLSTVANGDGSFDSITEVVVRVSDADASVTLTALDLEGKSRWKFGSYLKNEGTDSEERTTRYEPGPGTWSITSLDTLGDALTHEDAVVYDVETPFRYTLEASADSMPYGYRIESASDYPGYDAIIEQRGDLKAPTAIDLTHSGLTLKDTVGAPPSRYQAVWTASGVSDTDLGDVDDSEKTYHGSSYDSQGREITLLSNPTAGTVYRVGADVLATAKERRNSIAGGGTGGSVTEDGGNLMTLLGGGGLFGAVTVIIGRIRGWF